MPNTFAYIALITWPFLSLVFFSKLKVLEAVFWTIVGGYLLLPAATAIHFPLIPPLDKTSIPIFIAVIGCLLISKINLSFLPQKGLEKWLILLFLFSPVVTSFNNSDVIHREYGVLGGYSLYAALATAFRHFTTILPLLIGMQIVKTYEDQLTLLKLFVIAGLAYSLPILFEIRMSPQLHTWIYGFFPHSFAQQVRYEGFRPVVFLGHGLIVAVFVSIVFASSIGLWKSKIRLYGVNVIVVIFFLLIVLILCKTFSAIIYGALFVCTAMIMSTKNINRCAIALAFFVLLYPIFFDYFPRDSVVDSIAEFDEGRALSLDFRYENEDRIFEHAKEKYFFGWGGGDRNTVRNSVTDGYWIIVFSKYGVIGFISVFGILALCVVRASRATKYTRNRNEKLLVAIHGLVVSVAMLDQLPNASLNSWLWLYVGGLLGRANYLISNKA